MMSEVDKASNQKGKTNMMPFQRLALKRLVMFMGLDQRGQLMGQTIMPNETTKVFVIPGQMSIIEITTPQGKTITERPIGQFGWEYTIADDPEDD